MIQFLDAANSTILAIFTQHASIVLTTAFSPDGRLVASGSADGAMYVWDVATASVQMLYAKKIAL